MKVIPKRSPLDESGIMFYAHQPELGANYVRISEERYHEMKDKEGVDVCGLLIAAANNKHYDAESAAIFRKMKQKHGHVDTGEYSEATLEAAAKTILLSWEGVRFYGETEDTPPTFENRRDAIGADRSLANFMWNMAKSQADFDRAAKDALEGKQSAGSTGNSSTETSSAA